MEDQALKRGSIQEQQAPYPWERVYLEQWKHFVAVVIDRYKNDPHVGYISLTGPTIRDLSTGILLKDDDDWKRFSRGIDVGKLLRESWIEIIEHYQSSSPAQRYAIALGPLRPASADVSVASDILEYILSKHYMNISIMCVFLNDTWFNTGLGAKKIRGLLKRAKESGFNVGYQMAQSAERNRTWIKQTPIVRNLRDSFAFGLTDGMEWVEVWHDDIIDRKSKAANMRYKNDIQNIHRRLRQAGH